AARVGAAVFRGVIYFSRGRRFISAEAGGRELVVRGSVANRSHGRAAVLVKGHVAVVLPQEIEESLVVVRTHAEQFGDDLVAAVRLLQAATDDFADVVAREVAR